MQYGKLSFLTSLGNGCIAAVFLVAVSGYFNEQYLKTDVKYCEYDPTLVGTEVEGCITSGILPWGWFSNCFKNTTAQAYTSQDELFSCRLCQETGTCIDSEPNDAYIENSSRTTVAALSYLVCCLSSVRSCTPSPRRAPGEEGREGEAGACHTHRSPVPPSCQAFGSLFAMYTASMMADGACCCQHPSLRSPAPAKPRARGRPRHQARDCKNCAQAVLSGTGRSPAAGRGHSPHQGQAPFLGRGAEPHRVGAAGPRGLLDAPIRDR